jgi:hypothetical protein
MSNNQEIKAGQRWFALTKENGKGTQHQVLMIEKDEDSEDDNLPEEPVIYTWSDSTEESGIAWRGPESEFRKIFKFIGFNNKNK